MSRKTAAERRVDALDAARRIIDREGIAHASVRAVATEAGMSAGSLRHIFPNHDDLFVALLEEGMADVRPRIEAVVGQARASRSTARETAIAMLLEVLPTRPDTRLEALSQLAVLVAHGSNERVVAARRRAGDGLDEFCRSILRLSVTPEQANALELRLLIDGLMLRLLERPDIGEEDVRAELSRVLTRMGVSDTGPAQWGNPA